jgi:hypothetical protein
MLEAWSGVDGQDPSRRGLARQMWIWLEAIHAVTYFTPQARAAHEAVGLRGFWRGYFAMRAAPLGAVGPAVVEATFAGFAPVMVARAVPEVWSMASPDTALAARLAGATASISIRVPRRPGGADLSDAAGLLARVVAAAPRAGRALGAANAGLGWPDDPLASLWHGATVIRELRGDGHVAVLTAEGLDGCLAHALRAAVDHSRTLVQPSRGFTDDEWDQADATLVDRGLVDTGERLTPAGARLVGHIAERTDALAAQGWEVLDADEIDRLRRLLAPLAARLGADAIPYPNPVGAPQPGQLGASGG